MGLHVKSTKLIFTISSKIRRALGSSELKAEILAAPTTKPTRLNITQYCFNAQSKVAFITGLRSRVVYNVRFFMMTGPTYSERKYFVNTFIKTGRPECELHPAILLSFFSFLGYSIRRGKIFMFQNSRTMDN